MAFGTHELYANILITLNVAYYWNFMGELHCPYVFDKSSNSFVPDGTMEYISYSLNAKEDLTKTAEEQNTAFGEILWNAYYFATIEGKKYGEPDSEGHEEYGTFAVYDVDGDGKEELLLQWAGSSMAATVEYIWGYENGAAHVELSEFPLMTYFDNGIIEAFWSHNQGLAGDFWPYSVYRYESDTDTYQSDGGVDAWDKKYAEKDNNGKSFPADIDRDGDGLVYYILPANI